LLAHASLEKYLFRFHTKARVSELLHSLKSRYVIEPIELTRWTRFRKHDSVVDARLYKKRRTPCSHVARTPIAERPTTYTEDMAASSDSGGIRAIALCA
jgi:hypothetical protein